MRSAGINWRRVYAFGWGSAACGAGRKIIARTEPHWLGWVVAGFLFLAGAAISCVGEDR